MMPPSTRIPRHTRRLNFFTPLPDTVLLLHEIKRILFNSSFLAGGTTPCSSYKWILLIYYDVHATFLGLAQEYWI
jgi:hypothetical protein